jgi:hypothetical protein
MLVSFISFSTTLLLLVGNRRFREVIEGNLSTYQIANTKQTKSKIVTGIVNTIRQHAGTSGFVKKVCFLSVCVYYFRFQRSPSLIKL